MSAKSGDSRPHLLNLGASSAPNTAQIFIDFPLGVRLHAATSFFLWPAQGWYETIRETNSSTLILLMTESLSAGEIAGFCVHCFK